MLLCVSYVLNGKSDEGHIHLAYRFGENKNGEVVIKLNEFIVSIKNCADGFTSGNSSVF